MADTPPPLPLETPLGTPGVMEESRVAPPHAPMFWRTLAFLVDASLVGMIGYLVTTRVLMPWLHPVETSALDTWATSLETFTQDGMRRVLERNGDVFAFYREVWDKYRDVPAPALDALEFQATCMFTFYWLGFAVMEALTQGASLGKKIFKLRAVRFPHGEDLSFFDHIVRSFWKSLAMAGFTPLALVFGIVDAHWPLFNPLRRSLHDIFSRTIVLDVRHEKPKPKKEKREDD